jgi:hypothetical protein
MSPLASRKKLLIAESELNRAQLGQEWRAMADNAHALAYRAGTIRSLAAMALTLASSLVSLRQKNDAPAAGKASWLQTILKGAQLAGAFWSEFRTPKK